MCVCACPCVEITEGKWHGWVASACCAFLHFWAYESRCECKPHKTVLRPGNILHVSLHSIWTLSDWFLHSIMLNVVFYRRRSVLEEEKARKSIMGPAKRFSDGRCQLLPTGRFLKAADRYIHTSNKYNVSHKFPKRPKTQRFKSSDLMFPIAVNICISVSHWNNVSLGFVQTCEGHVSSNALCHKSQIRT